jgi:4-amino-4-deoxy-L-arabinose transferase-like glycosyltransferase
MQRRKIQWGVLFAVVVLATALRVYQLKDVPAGLFCDEAALGYNAWAIGTTGMDENGKYFPLFVWSFGGYKNPVYIYSAIIPIKLLGLDEFSLRLTSALFGVGTVIGIFFLGRALFTPWVGLFAAVFLTVCPWHLHFSRVAFELISFPFLFVIGLTLLVRYTEGRRTLSAAMFLFGLCLYAYAIAAVFVPLFLIGFTLLYLPTLVRRWRETLLAFVVVVVTVAPFGIFYLQHREATMYFRTTTSLSAALDWRAQAERFERNYLEFFNRTFLFRNGDPISRHSVRGFGELLPFYAPFLLLGIVVAAAYPDRRTKLVLWWLALYPVGASMMLEIPSASRGFIGAPAFCLLAAIGFAAALRALGWAARWRPLALTLQTAALAVAGYFLAPQVRAYLHAYFVEYPKYSAPTYGGFQYGYRDAIHYMESQRSHYDLLMMTAVEVNQPQIFPLFYNRIDPREWVKHHDPGYLILDPAEYSRYSMNQRILYALRPTDLDMFSDYTIQRKIVAPGGQVEFVIAEVRARKRFLTNWLVLGLFLNDNGEGVDRNFIDVGHLTRNAYQGAFNRNIYWRQILPQFVRVDLNSFFALADPRNPGNPEHVCAYAAVTVRSPSAQRAFLELAGSDDYMKAWLNGSSLTPGPVMLSEVAKRRPIDLKAGASFLIVKSCENIGTWYFTARITDESGRDVPDVTTAPEIPEEPVPVAAAPAPSTNTQVVEGFGSILTFKHTDEKYPDYRGGTKSWWAYVRDPESEVTWRTAPCPQKKRTIFVLTASMSEAPGEAELFVNGTYVLTFNLSNDPGTHTWERGPYRLTFVSKAAAGGNSGILLLDVPSEQITAGQPVEVRVVPSKAQDNSWFMIKDYHDTIAHEHVTSETAAEMVHATWQSRPD